MSVSVLKSWLTKREKSTIVIWGENHSDPKDIKAIRKAIIEFEPSIILHELAYQDQALRFEVKKRLKECRVGGICDPRLNKDVYELALELDIGLLGIDITVLDGSRKERMQAREQHMLEMIKLTADKMLYPKIAVVVGDTHLRDKTKTLGEPSVLLSLTNDPNVTIKRSTNPERID